MRKWVALCLGAFLITLLSNEKTFAAQPASAGSGAGYVFLPAPVAELRRFYLTDPPRVVFDFPGAENWPGAPDDAQKEGALIAALRMGATGDGLQLVVDLTRPAWISDLTLSEEEGEGRLSFRLLPADEAAFAARAGWPDDLARPPAPPVTGPAAEPGATLIVIDPGHGGGDPGAISNGIQEKDVVLYYAQALAAAIAKKPGFDAALTRVGDEYLSLRARVAIARAAGASALISLHADALAGDQAEGASVYVLSDEAAQRESLAFARAEERGEMLAGIDLDREELDIAQMLADFARRRAQARSVRLGDALLARLGEAAPILKGRGVQQAGFMVLRSPDIPSALIELGFLSSEEDRARILSPAMRDQFAEAIARGVEDWAHAQAQEPE